MAPPPQTVHSNGHKYVFVSTMSSPNVHEYLDGSEHVVIKQTTDDEANTLRSVGKKHANIIQYKDSLGDEIVAGHKTPRRVLLVMEKADAGTLEDLIKHVRSLSSTRNSSRHILPAEFLYNVLASIIDAVLYLETSLTTPLQHIDCHIGNIAFSRHGPTWPAVKLLDFHRIQTGDKGDPSPAVGLFARNLLEHRSVLPPDFVGTLESLSAPLTSLETLASVQALALAKARAYTPVPGDQWLIDYFNS